MTIGECGCHCPVKCLLPRHIPKLPAVAGARHQVFLPCPTQGRALGSWGHCLLVLLILRSHRRLMSGGGLGLASWMLPTKVSGLGSLEMGCVRVARVPWNR